MLENSPASSVGSSAGPADAWSVAIIRRCWPASSRNRRSRSTSVSGLPSPCRRAPSREALFHDVEVYYDYANRTFAGEVPYRDFTVEYPPGGLVAFLTARVFAPSYYSYKKAMGFEMLAFNAATLMLAASWTASRWGDRAGPHRCLAWYSAFFLLSLPTSMARYDLAATFAAFATVYLLESGRPIAGGAMTAASVLLKIFPGAVAGPAFVRELVHLRSSRPRAILAAGLVFAVGVGGVGRPSPRGDGVLRTIGYHGERGLEIGSIYAGAMMLAARVGGWEIEMPFNHFASHLETPTAMRLASFASLFQIGAFLLALGAYWRSGMRDGLRYSTACLLAFITFGKILSPQYLYWLGPFFACLGGRPGGRARVAFLICSGLTLLVFPLFIRLVTEMTPVGMFLLNARNLALVVTYGLLIFDRPAESRAA